ncbi:MAG: carotenoid biosynthesis protein [Actinomycetota bacterium]
MSIHQFRPRRFARRGASGKQLLVLYLGLLGLLGLQIAYPLIHGNALRIDTLVTVYLAVGILLFHSLLTYGFRFAATFAVVTFGFALGIEILGVKTHWPFGTYHYSPSLGVQLFGVPLLVPFAWIMISYPILLAARRVAVHWVFLYGGIGLMVWDLFLDPQMVDAGRWVWKLKGPHVPYEPMIPLSNAAGWLFAGMGLMALLNKLLPDGRRKRRISSLVPDLFLFWSYIAGIIGNIFFFHHKDIGIFVGIVFGLLIAPYFFQRRFGRPDII